MHLVVDEREAEDIGENENDLLLSVIGRGGRNVTFDATDLLNLALNMFAM